MPESIEASVFSAYEFNIKSEDPRNTIERKSRKYTIATKIKVEKSALGKCTA